MGKVHGWRIFKDVHQFKCICAVKWTLNATKYLFCCVQQLYGYRMGLLLFGIGYVVLGLYL